MFPDLNDTVYLDTASKGVPPAATVRALHAAIAEWSAGTADLAEWDAAMDTARARVASLLAVDDHDVALLPSQVAAASTIARRMPDASVVVPTEEFRSNLLPWTLDRERVRLVPAPATTEAICAAVDAGTDLVAVSSVQSATGLRVDLPAVVRHAHERGALVYVDASQSLGVDGSLAGCGADFIGAVAYKWLLGTRGAAFLKVAREHQSLAPSLVGGQAASDGAFYGAEHTYWPDARRFDQPPAWLAWIATAASLTSVDDLGAPAAAHATALAAEFRSGLADLGMRHGPVDVESPIVSLQHQDADTAARSLAANGIQVAARAGKLRFAFHLYNDRSHVERSLAALQEVRP